MKPVQQQKKDNMISFGELIRAKRKEEGFSLSDVADCIGMDKSALSRIENGISLPNSNNLIKISIFYNISLEELKWCYICQQNKRERKND